AQLPRRWKQRWKRRRVEKSPNRLSPPAWKSRQRRGIPTFPPLRRLRVYEQKPKPKNRTFHLLQKADIFTCYEQEARHKAVCQDRPVRLDCLWPACESLLSLT